MSRVTIPLTDTKIKNSKPKDKEYNLVDGNGLTLRVMPSGSKKWLFNYYRPFTKKRTNIGLGTYPELSLLAARKKRQVYREQLTKEIDPKEHRDEINLKEQEAFSNTLEHVASQWLVVKQSSVTKDHASDIWRSLELHIFPNLGKTPIHKIQAKKTISFIQPIAQKGSLETVRRLCQRLNEVMVFAVNTGIIEANPLAGIYKAFAVPAKSHMPTIKPSELPKLMKAISRASIKFTTRRLIEWQLHTIVRPGEAAGTKWDEIDIEQRIWVIPAERMKKKKEHVVPLTEQSIFLLEEMKTISSHREYVFPSNNKPRSHANPSTANVALKRMGYGGVLVAHGLRSLASTTLNEQGFNPDVIEAALAHVDNNDVRRAYNHAEYLEQRRKLMYWWSEYIDQATTVKLSHINNVKTFRKIK